MADALRTASQVSRRAPQAGNDAPHLDGWLSGMGQRLRERIAALHDTPARMALRITNMAPVRRHLSRRYQKALASHHQSLPLTHPIDREIVKGLRRDGVFVTDIASLACENSQEVLQLATTLAESFAPEARRQVAAGKDFVIVPPDELLRRPEIFRWGLQSRLMAIAEAYIGLPIGYDGVSLNYTVADGREVSTRRWHRDWEDRRMLKVAVYLNDVDEDGGPFQMIKCREAVQDDATGFTYEVSTDQDLAVRLGDDFHERIHSCTGKAGTVVFTDTAGYYHRGKPAVTRDRKALFYSYFARTPRHPFFCERSGLSRRDLRMMLPGLNSAQRAAVEWRKTVPLYASFIPPARL